MTRKEQIEAFKKAHMKFEDTPKARMECTRAEFLAYAFIRGRYYQQAERRTRPYEEKGGAPILNTIHNIRKWFPTPDPVPVTVPPEEERTPRKYPWPEVDYDQLKKQVVAWATETAPDRLEFIKKELQARISHSQRRVEERMKYTPEYIQALRDKAIREE
jgi:hypothetical protein